MDIFIIIVCFIIFTVAIFHPKTWNVFFPRALLLPCCLFLLLYLGVCIWTQPRADITVGVNEYVQDRISKKCRGFNNFVLNVEEDIKSMETDRFYTKYHSGSFLFITSHSGPVLSKLIFYHDKPVQESVEIAWSKQISLSLPSFSKMCFMLFDFHRIVFFGMMVNIIILAWNSGKSFVSESINFITSIIKVLLIIVFCSMSLYYAKKMLPDARYDISVNQNFDVNKLSDPMFTVEANKVFYTENNSTGKLCDLLGVHEVFVATDKTLYVPHIRWNGSLFEYYFFVPNNYSPSELNPYLSWNKIHDVCWHAKYWPYYIIWKLNKLVVHGLYLVSCFLIICFIISLIKNIFCEKAKL